MALALCLRPTLAAASAVVPLLSLSASVADVVLVRLEARSLLHATRPILLAPPPGALGRVAVEIQLDHDTLHQWLAEEMDRNLILFFGNDYMCLSSHLPVREAAVKAAQEYGMGPRGSALICSYTTYHKFVEESLVELKRNKDCLLCPTGFSANMARMTALGSISSLLAAGRKHAEDERITIFSDALKHATIIDGIRLLERHLFSMDADFALFPEPVKLRRNYGFLLVIDDAHGTPVCGENGGGAAQLFKCKNDIDISVGTLSKAASC